MCSEWRERQSQAMHRIPTAMHRIAWVIHSCIHSASTEGAAVVCKGTVAGPGDRSYKKDDLSLVSAMFYM